MSAMNIICPSLYGQWLPSKGAQLPLWELEAGTWEVFRHRPPAQGRLDSVYLATGSWGQQRAWAGAGTLVLGQLKV